MLSVIIPAHNEEMNVEETVRAVYSSLLENGIDHEIIVVNDNSRDNTLAVINALFIEIKSLVVCNYKGPSGYGYAVRHGFEKFKGGHVAVMMGDLSDSPDDLVLFYKKALEGYDCVFGTRWTNGGTVYDYPKIKKILNRVFNGMVQMLFGIKYNDCTNAFKLYSRETILGLKPLLSPHFNLTLELPLKAIIRGYSYAVLPNSWRNRKHGESKLKLKEMGSRYFFILLYCLIEKFFSKGDYRKAPNGM